MNADKCIHNLLRKSMRNKRLFIVERLATMNTPAKPCKCGKNNEKHNNLTYALFITCRDNDLDSAKTLFEINKKIMLMQPISRKTKKAKLNHYAIKINAIIEYYGRACIHESVSNDNIDLIALLLQNGANINLKDDEEETPLTVAILNESIDVIDFLLRHGSNPNLKDDEGETPLIRAISCKNIKIIELLLQHGADTGLKNAYGETPLIYAISTLDYDNITDIINLLVEKTIDLNEQDNDGDTALHLAVENELPRLIKSLMKKGANCFVKNNFQNTPIDIILSNHDYEILRMTLKYNNNLTDLRTFVKKNSQLIKKNKKIATLFGLGNVGLKCMMLAEAHNFDENSLVYRDYLCRDLLLGILTEVHIDYYFDRYNIGH